MRDEGFAEAACWDDRRQPDPWATDPEPEESRLLGSALAGGAIALWLAAALGLAWPGFLSLRGVALIEFLAALAVVPVLVVGLWLVARRGSRAEARRFGETAAAMRWEAAELERRVGALSATIDRNRAEMAAQSQALIEMGESAAARLHGIGHGVGMEVARIEGQAQAIQLAAAAAQANVGALVEALPRARAGVEEATATLDQAGVAAAEHAATLEFRLEALAAQGRDAEATARGAAEALAARTADLETRGDAAGARLRALGTDLSRVMDALVARSGEVEGAVERAGDRLDAQRAAGELWIDQLRNGVGDVEGRLERLHAQGSERAQTLAASISALGGSADAMTESLRAGDEVATRTIGTTESLLIALDAAAREIDETLPDALRRLDDRIAGTKRVIGDAKPELLALVTAAESTHDAIEAIAGVVAEQRRTLDQLSGQLLDTLEQGRAKADALGRTVDDAVGGARRFADNAAPQLVQSLLRIRDAAASSAAEARATLATVVPETVAELERAGAEALRRATAGAVERQVEALAAATDVAVDAAARAAERVARETQAIADQAALLEARIEETREQLGRDDRADMARRVAGLIERLNSAAIDVAKALSAEVADSAWAAYLKGDRGVFTRRAVRLLDGETAREVARLHEADDAFRDSVNRYIHDFEAMLRAILAQPDGQALSITLLSSDMGKLYVALAQAIERLR